MYRFPPQVDFAVAVDVLEQAAAAGARQPGEQVYDLAACERFDSSLLTVLLELARRAEAAGVSCRFAGANDKLLKLAELYGVGRLLFGQAAGTGDPAVRAGAAA